jgi:long-chain acyl-CoA synthetase
MVDANPSPVDFSQIATVADIARYHAKVRGGNIALSFEGRDTSFAALDAAASRVANALLAAGVKHGEHIAYIGKNSDHYFEIFMGAAKIGAVLTPIGPCSSTPPEPQDDRRG